MTSLPILTEAYFLRPVQQVARDLLGALLVRQVDGQRVSGIIVETEAYDGEQDLACHAKAGNTPRTRIMYGPPGHAYVYFTYGFHWMLNCVCGQEGYPAAVLLRAVLPVEGLEQISTRRPGRKEEEWTNGPAKICQGLSINRAQNGVSLCTDQNGLWIERKTQVDDGVVKVTPRIGINSVPEPWLSKPWRYVILSPGAVFAKP